VPAAVADGAARRSIEERATGGARGCEDDGGDRVDAEAERVG
jgi:hypothetical protein